MDTEYYIIANEGDGYVLSNIAREVIDVSRSSAATIARTEPWSPRFATRASHIRWKLAGRPRLPRPMGRAQPLQYGPQTFAWGYRGYSGCVGELTVNADTYVAGTLTNVGHYSPKTEECDYAFHSSIPNLSSGGEYSLWVTVRGVGSCYRVRIHLLFRVFGYPVIGGHAPVTNGHTILVKRTYSGGNAAEHRTCCASSKWSANRKRMHR